MRAVRISLLVLLIALVGGGIAWLLLRKSEPQSIVLPDGSQMTLLTVTSGRNNICRYGQGWKDFLYPLLPLKLRVRLSARVMEFNTYNHNTVMVWFRRDGWPSSGNSPTRLYLSVADEHGLETPLQLTAHTTRTIGSMPGTIPTGTAVAQISGWDLSGYPKRSAKFRVLFHTQALDGKLARVGEFRISNPLRPKFPIWKAEPLPVTKRTNGLEVTLTGLTTGMTSSQAPTVPVGVGATVFTRATFRLRENAASTEKWSVDNVRLSSATGDARYGDNRSSRWWNGELVADLWGGAWLEEPAWKVEVNLARTGNFSAEDLWGIKAVPVPQPGEMAHHRVETNLHAVTLEFQGVSVLKRNPAESQVKSSYGIIHVRTQYPLDSLRVVMVEARDDRGRIAEPHGISNTIGTGGGGNTPKESLTGFRIEIPEGAKTLDVTLAATPISHVEFLAKPVMFTPPVKAAD